MRIVILGPQGSGKGTQAELLEADSGARHISMGDIVRAEIRSHSPLGESIRQDNERGELVPDETILMLIRPVLSRETNWILDGFPRDQAQAQALDDALREESIRLDRVVALELPEEAITERLAGRRQSESTGAVYHLVHNPPPPTDHGPFVVRADDEPDRIRRRLELYHAVTEPLKRYYDTQGVLARVDANGPIPVVQQRIRRVLASY